MNDSAIAAPVSSLVPEGADAWQRIRPLFRCPVLGTPLDWDSAAGALRAGDRRYPVADGIPCLFAPNEWPAGRSDVTDMVKAFYEDTPFPNYDSLDSRESLAAKAGHGVFAQLLDAQLPRPLVMLEAGCGTGQLSNFLGMGWNRIVIGGDVCLNSLRLAKSFRDRFSVNNAQFVQMNLFRPPFADETFDVIVTNGVLHHTSDPHGGFRALVRKLKPGGVVLVGLYNSLGRLPTLWRRRLIEVFGDGLATLDSRLRGKRLNEGRWQAWFRDQYKHPHESKHSIDEVLEWFAEAAIAPLTSIPMVGDREFSEDSRLFESHPMGTHVERLATQLNMLLEGGSDGGLFIMIGRKSAAREARAA
jgi:SAM-dependent methyltransferase